MSTTTHADLVAMAARWLRNSASITNRLSSGREYKQKLPCPVVIVEPACGGESPDAIGWKYHAFFSVLIECKATRADFLSDKSKPWRKPGYVGPMGRWRFYLAPAGLIQPAEVPEGWGLLEANGQRIRKIKEAPEHVLGPESLRNEMALLWSDLRLWQMLDCGKSLFQTKRAVQMQTAFAAANSTQGTNDAP